MSAYFTGLFKLSIICTNPQPFSYGGPQFWIYVENDSKLLLHLIFGVFHYLYVCLDVTTISNMVYSKEYSRVNVHSILFEFHKNPNSGSWDYFSKGTCKHTLTYTQVWVKMLLHFWQQMIKQNLQAIAVHPLKVWLPDIPHKQNNPNWVEGGWPKKPDWPDNQSGREKRDQTV